MEWLSEIFKRARKAPENDRGTRSLPPQDIVYYIALSL